MDNFISQVIAVTSVTPAYWERLTQTVPGELLSRPPAPGEWSAVECLQHIIDIEAVLNFRLQAFLAGQDFPAFNPDQEGTQSAAAPAPADLAQKFAGLRNASLEKLAQLTPADLDRTARHAELGPVTLRQMLNEWAAHDLDHTIQAQEALIQPFLQACGPWQIYFQSHVLANK
jgi:hypothetical protein